MTFASRVFKWAGIYGILAVAPMYFLERRIGMDAPPPITHPEYFYGFIGVALAWQFLFLVIAKDPVRFRSVMLAGILEKVTFGVACWVLYAQGRVMTATMGFATFDLVLAVLFCIAYRKTPAK